VEAGCQTWYTASLGEAVQFQAPMLIEHFLERF
jgi:hypothetical protein